MSYTNETTHYGIPLPLGTDKTTPMDYNTSMQEVDTVLFGAKSDSDSALRKAQQVETGLSQTDENVSGIAGRVATLEGTSTTQGNAIQQNAQDIADVRADALDMIEAKDEGTAQVATVAVNKGEYFRYNDVLYKATQNIGVGTTIVPNTNCRATNVGTELTKLGYDTIVSVTGNSSDTYSTLIAKLQNLIDYSKVTIKSKVVMTSSGVKKVFNVSQLYQNTVQLSSAVIPGSTTNWLHTIQVSTTPIYYLTSIGSSGAETTDVASNSAENVTLEFMY